MFFKKKRKEISREDFESIFGILKSPHRGEDFEEEHKDTLKKFQAKVSELHLEENIYLVEKEVKSKGRFDFQGSSTSKQSDIIVKNLKLTDEFSITLNYANKWDRHREDWTWYGPNKFIFKNNWFEKNCRIASKSAIEIIDNEGHYLVIQANIDARQANAGYPKKITVKNNQLEQVSVVDGVFDQISQANYYREGSKRQKIDFIDMLSNNFEKLHIQFNHLETGEITFLEGNNIGHLSINDSETFPDGSSRIRYGESIKFGLKENIDSQLKYYAENKPLFIHLLRKAEQNKDKLQETAVNRLLRHLDRGFALRVGNHSLLWLNDFFESGTSLQKPLYCILGLGVVVTILLSIATLLAGSSLSVTDFIHTFSLSLSPLVDLKKIVNIDCKLLVSGLNVLSLIHKGLYAYFLYYLLKAIYRYNI